MVLISICVTGDAQSVPAATQVDPSTAINNFAGDCIISLQRTRADHDEPRRTVRTREGWNGHDYPRIKFELSSVTALIKPTSPLSLTFVFFNLKQAARQTWHYHGRWYFQTEVLLPALLHPWPQGRTQCSSGIHSAAGQETSNVSILRYLANGHTHDDNV